MGAHSVRPRRCADTARTVRRVAGTSVLSAAAVSSLVGGAGFAQAQEVTSSSGSTTVDVETPQVTVPSVPPVSVQAPTTCDIILGSGLASTFPESAATQRCTTQETTQGATQGTTRYTQADTAGADDTTDETSGGSTGSATPASTAPTSTAPADSSEPAASSEPASSEPAESSEPASPASESSSTPADSGSSTQAVDEPAGPGETKSVPIR